MLSPRLKRKGYRVSDLRSIPGGADLIAWFGDVPTFGDAEILDLHLERGGPSTIRLHIRRRDPEATARSVSPFADHAVVSFVLDEIVGLSLQDFSPQNVIGGVKVHRLSEGGALFDMDWLTPPEPQAFFEVVLEPCFGLSGTIRAKRVSITFTPGSP